MKREYKPIRDNQMGYKYRVRIERLERPASNFLWIRKSARTYYRYYVERHFTSWGDYVHGNWEDDKDTAHTQGIEYMDKLEAKDKAHDDKIVEYI